jgi:hypothetical protein
MKNKRSLNMRKLMKNLAIFWGMALLTGCAMPHIPLPYDASNPLKHVAVLPMKNDTNDVDGPDVMRNKMVKALENHSYVVQDLKKTDQILRDRMGISLGGQIDLATAQKLGQELGVEGLLYGTLMDFGELTTGAINVKKVRGKFKLVNAMTGQTVWARGLGVRSEMRMEGGGGAAAAIAARAADKGDKEVPWETINSTTTGSDKLGKSFMVGLGEKFASKAFGVHLDRESTELARRVTSDLPWGPGTATETVATAPPPKFAMPEIKMPEPPSFGYMDWEGKRDFSAVIHSTSLDKNRNEPFLMVIPIAVTKKKMRMDMDMSKMMKGDNQSPLSKMSIIERGDKKIGYTLYPNTKKYMVNPETESVEEKPKVEKIKVGREVIDKYHTEKYKVRIIYKDGKTEEGFIWNARELGGMTIKSEVENKDFKITTEIKNIVLKTPPASLFEIPAGYTEASSFMDIMAPSQKTK